MAESKKSYKQAIGRRKTAVAQVRLTENGSGKTLINHKVIEDTNDALYSAPLKLVGRFENTDISVVVKGGGSKGQLEAIRHGISRALLEIDENFRTTLKKAGFLTRDPREKERKKFGLKKARRSPQWSKR